MNKLKRLAEIEGYDSIEEMLEQSTFDSTIPAICTNADCEATYWYEPDCIGGWCEECGTNSVSSCLILAGMI
jgi:hypothetical protein